MDIEGADEEYVQIAPDNINHVFCNGCFTYLPNDKSICWKCFGNNANVKYEKCNKNRGVLCIKDDCYFCYKRSFASYDMIANNVSINEFGVEIELVDYMYKVNMWDIEKNIKEDEKGNIIYITPRSVCKAVMTSSGLDAKIVNMGLKVV